MIQLLFTGKTWVTVQGTDGDQRSMQVVIVALPALRLGGIRWAPFRLLNRKTRNLFS